MKSKIPIYELLRWRLEHAKSEAPLAPPASRLLDLSLPWWERQPEKFQLLMAQLEKIPPLDGRRSSKSSRSHRPQLVPALFVRGSEKFANSVSVQYFRVRDGRFRLRFKLDTALMPAEPTLQATFISVTGGRPLLCVTATVLASGGYSVDMELPPELAQDWEQVKVTDRMPFRLILRSGMTVR